MAKLLNFHETTKRQPANFSRIVLSDTDFPIFPNLHEVAWAAI
ncbi:hypothetical protein [uncultured Muribaculum sp.]|nr:hypothetical protein [uncultured Muribaculum sp.]